MRKRLFAKFWGWFEPRTRRGFARYRAEMVADLDGRVLEIGCGNGSNFQHYASSTTVVATDYSEYMLKPARAAAEAASATIEVQAANAMELPFEDGNFDAVVSSLVLCSVPDQGRSLAELRRVLRAGGELRLFEHVRSQRTWVAVLQRVATSLWQIPGDGCHLDRDTERAVRDAGFKVESSERLALGLPHVQLRARTPRA
jgi:ubiquinone/menaquinone biosynthesis C-methylase UbiE